MKDFFKYGNPRFDNKKIDDCYIRAIVFASKMQYDEVEILFQRKQIELQADLPNRPCVVEAVIHDLGYSFTDTINPKTGRGSMRIYSFLKNNRGKYVLKLKNHLCYAENGKIIDTWDSSNNLLVGYWTVN